MAQLHVRACSFPHDLLDLEAVRGVAKALRPAPLLPRRLPHHVLHAWLDGGNDVRGARRRTSSSSLVSAIMGSAGSWESRLEHYRVLSLPDALLYVCSLGVHVLGGFLTEVVSKNGLRELRT